LRYVAIENSAVWHLFKGMKALFLAGKSILLLLDKKAHNVFYWFKFFQKVIY